MMLELLQQENKESLDRLSKALFRMKEEYCKYYPLGQKILDATIDIIQEEIDKKDGK